jgi:hypothetical protein
MPRFHRHSAISAHLLAGKVVTDEASSWQKLDKRGNGLKATGLFIVHVVFVARDFV